MRRRVRRPSPRPLSRPRPPIRSPGNDDDPQRCGGLQGGCFEDGKCADERDDPAELCKSFDGDPTTGQSSLDLKFFGRNFLFAPVYQPNPCDTARTCETNSLGNPVG